MPRRVQGDPPMAEPIELVDPDEGGDKLPRDLDRRPRIPQPPPVRLLTVEDASIPAPAGSEPLLDRFYISILGFERDLESDGSLTYRAANFRLRVEVVEPPIPRFDMRPLGVEVDSLSLIELRLREAELEFGWQTGVVPALRSILLQDPAGNWVEISEVSLFQ